jgi:hypothetical protein
MTKYTDMEAGDMISALGNDAMKWAEAFREQYPDVPQDAAFGWFANAMMTMWDVTNSNATHSDEALCDHISSLVRNRDLWRELADADAERSEVTATVGEADPGTPQ